ncbi:MAG: hypothetical protein ACI83E_002800, partial [Sulfitobacter sp.]
QQYAHSVSPLLNSLLYQNIPWTKTINHTLIAYYPQSNNLQLSVFLQCRRTQGSLPML